jgi:hypothetical protein
MTAPGAAARFRFVGLAGSFAPDEELAAAIIHLTAITFLSSSAGARRPVR